jgi:hypothetical protein
VPIDVEKNVYQRLPGFISTVRPDLPQSTHRLEEEDTFGGILFLSLKVSHLHPKYRVFNGIQDWVKTWKTCLSLIDKVRVTDKTYI